ncbi:hypothetical protein ebA2668 [Aromatoleum aromaticum EbN1]|uniref:Uncharacterized protein n=1 Tax=Aromatoleum aromaticum (strain DSM 19018 / LMG 30748 / EbN1) TaxID=76114 RepID=Q5P4Y7_AROAE|nr:hypothetical protein ebA2668 [Aromatoleum aromaticum EbN1]
MDVRNADFFLSAPPPGAFTAILRWRLYGDHRLAPLRRSGTGAITPITTWRLYADPALAPLRRSVTACLPVVRIRAAATERRGSRRRRTREDRSQGQEAGDPGPQAARLFATAAHLPQERAQARMDCEPVQENVRRVAARTAGRDRNPDPGNRRLAEVAAHRLPQGPREGAGGPQPCLRDWTADSDPT